MESALNVNDDKTAMVDAKTLKELTPSREQLVETLKNNILDQVMSSMVQSAKNGATSYNAQFEAAFNPAILSDITKEFSSLGYVVTTSEGAVAAQKMLVLNLSWA